MITARFNTAVISLSTRGASSSAFFVRLFMRESSFRESKKARPPGVLESRRRGKLARCHWSFSAAGRCPLPLFSYSFLYLDAVVVADYLYPGIDSHLVDDLVQDISGLDDSLVLFF